MLWLLEIKDLLVESQVGLICCVLMYGWIDMAWCVHIASRTMYKGGTGQYLEWPAMQRSTFNVPTRMYMYM